ncbi:MAG: arginine--tRNA ligase [Verrucomicrobiota bacterium]|nr:arginine--tRNA ligase [Verrucomicrobiota bacterium]
METFQAQLAQKLAVALAAADLPPAGEISAATDARFGDYQTNAALILAKQRGENPRALAQTIIEHLAVADISETPTVAGAGFINFTLRPAALEQKTSALLQDERLGVALTNSPKKIVIDFGSPNVAKPMHIGHIRSTVLGDALARIAQFLGHDVVRDNHIGDWGKQFGMLIVGWRHFVQLLGKEPTTIGELVRIYRMVFSQQWDEFAEEAGDTGSILSGSLPIEKQISQAVVSLQAKEPEELEIWNKCVAISMREFARTYDLLGIRYDIQRGESFYNDRLAGIVDRLLAAGIAQPSEGAIVVFFPDIAELADKPCLIRKSDGGYNYATSDLATVDYRVHDLHADVVWYVVGAPQILHFKQIFAIARREGFTTDFRHITFGSILGDDRKLMKTRSGENVLLQDVLDEAIVRARQAIAEKNPEMPEAEIAEVARIIGIGAIKYADLSQYRMTDYIFSWDRMLALQGNTAPYLQNAYVRIQSIFRKSATDSSEGRASARPQQISLGEPAERNLAKRLAQFAEIVPTVLNDFRPNVLANYLFELANNFHAFYEACPVLKSEEPARSSRLALCQLTARTLQLGLNLLGIQVPQRM